MDNDDRLELMERELAGLRAALAGREGATFGEGLREREALLSEAERIVHLGSWTWDTTTSVIRWSDELFRIFGLEPGTPPTSELFFGGMHPDDAGRVAATAARSLETRTTEPIDFRVVRPDGEVREVHMEAAIVETGGGLRMVGTVLDITERRAIEERLRRTEQLETVGRLASGVAHDFNNFLQVIATHVELALRPGADRAAIEEGLLQIRDAAGRAQQLVRQLLAFGRRRAAQPVVVSVDELLDASMPMLTTLVGDTVRLRCVRGTGDLRVRVDPAGMVQVIMNLVVNARDAMPSGGRITIDVEALEVAADDATLPPGRYAGLAIEDEGVGIPPEVLPHIFEPFFTTKGPGRGTGLGLATAHAFLTELGGGIRVTSAVGRGTTVRLLLPVTAVADGPRLRGPGLGPTRARVLVVEDEPAVRRVVCLLLEGEGYEVYEAEHGVAALRVIDQTPDLALVVSDVAMPHMTGPELARKLAVDRPALPTLLMGGALDSEAAGVGAGVLHKPFSGDELLRAVGDLLAGRGPGPG